MANYYLSKNYKNTSTAGNKAKTDIESILTSIGYRNIGIKTHHKNNILGFIATFSSILKACFSMRKNDILVLQYPLKKYYTFICKIARLRKCRTITLIHDLGSFRRKKLTIEKEIQRLNNSDTIIAHNTSMENFLREHHLLSPVVCLQIFDYLSPAPAQERKVNHPYQVVYAGALNFKKNPFLYKIGGTINNYQMYVYGSGFNAEEAIGAEHITYKGFVPSDELIRTTNGDFGLVWDGDSLDCCSGDMGEYLKWNNPHKTSLYIRCLLPVIIWEQAALAPFIREHKIGICINNLQELDKHLQNLSSEEYFTMKKNVSRISEQLASGHYCIRAIKEAEKLFMK